MQACNALKVKYVYLNLSVLEAPDLLGLPVVDKNTNKSKYALPEQFPIDGEEQVLIVDEIDKAKPELQAPMLELFQFRSINGQKLAFKAVIATGNRPDEGAFSMLVNKALTNRCKVYQFLAEVIPWLDWGLQNSVSGIILGFLRRNPDLFLKPNDSGDSTAYCSPSPRAWTLASEELAILTPQELADSRFVSMILSGYVGMEAASKLKIWMDYYQKIIPLMQELIDTGKFPQLDSMDEQFVAGIFACNEIKFMSQSNDPEFDEKANRVIKWLLQIPAEIKEVAFCSTFDLEIIKKHSLHKNKMFFEMFKETSMNRMSS
jgi:hypothetical protein